MTQSANHHLMNRREALLLGATAGVGAALAPAALAMDNTKTAAHQQEPRPADADICRTRLDTLVGIAIRIYAPLPAEEPSYCGIKLRSC